MKKNKHASKLKKKNKTKSVWNFFKLEKIAL